MTFNKWFYSIPDEGDMWPLMSCYGSDDLDLVAEEAADDYHSDHGGWEASWPKVFCIHETQDGPEIARFEVERDFTTTFSAARIEAAREPR